MQIYNKTNHIKKIIRQQNIGFSFCFKELLYFLVFKINNFNMHLDFLGILILFSAFFTFSSSLRLDFLGLRLLLFVLLPLFDLGCLKINIG